MAVPCICKWCSSLNVKMFIVSILCMVTYCTDSRRVSNACIKEVSTCVNAFVMGYAGVERRDIKSDKKALSGSCPSCSSLLRKCVVCFMKDCVVCTRGLR